MPHFPLLPDTEVTLLDEAIQYQITDEVKRCCEYLGLPVSGTKGDMIARMMLFIKAGKVLEKPKLPEVSKAKRGESYPFAPDTLILKGSYKCSHDTRAFLKQLVGPHFHFTYYGQNWIRERWQQGSPPTYLEFAVFWEEERIARKSKDATPNREWAYLHFAKAFKQNNPNASQKYLANSWHMVRTQKAALTTQLVEKAAAKL